MTYSWVLIIAMFSPGGDFIGNQTINFVSKKDCEAVRMQLPNLNRPMHIKYKGMCVNNGI